VTLQAQLTAVCKIKIILQKKKNTIIAKIKIKLQKKFFKIIYYIVFIAIYFTTIIYCKGMKTSTADIFMTFDYLPMALLVFEIISTFIGRRFK
jgi:hypothetical protein